MQLILKYATKTQQKQQQTDEAIEIEANHTQERENMNNEYYF